MKRWEPYQTDGRDPMHEDSHGEWVTFEDAAKEIHKLNNELTAVTLERDALKRELEKKP